MKPKTLLEKRVVELNSMLKPISEKQKKWTIDNCFDKFFVLIRSTNFCLECGHSWRNSQLINQVRECPQCHSILHHFENNRVKKQGSYFGILTTKEDHQVFRIFLVQKYMKKNQKPEFFFPEVMQHWINSKGEVVNLSLSAHPFSQFYDAWNYSSTLEVRKGYRQDLRNRIVPFKTYPNRNILPQLKRNGFTGNFFRYEPQRFFSLLLNESRFETLLKTKQYSMVKHFENIRNIEQLWPSIKICIRNSYIIPDASVWADYIKLLSFFGKDIRNPKFVCPPDLQKAHDKYMERKRKHDAKQKIEENEKRIKSLERIYRKEKSKFFKLRFSHANITVEPLKSVKDFIVEGTSLNHCIFTNEYFEKKDSLLLSAKVNGVRTETVEISLRNLSIAQARGLNNKPTKHHNQIIKLVQQNIPKIAQLVEAS